MTGKRTLRTKVLTGVKWSVGGRLLGQLFTWASTLFVIRILTPTDYGLMAIATSVTGLCMLLNEFGLTTAMLQVRTLTALAQRQIFSIVLLTNLAMALLLFWSASFFARFFERVELELVIQVLSVQFLFLGFTVIPSARLMRGLRFEALTVARFISTLSVGVTSLLLALNDFGVWSLVYGSITGTVTYVIYINLILPNRRFPTMNWQGFGKLLRLSAHNSVQKVFWYIQTKADVWIIGRMLGAKELGTYSVAYQLSQLPLEKLGSVIQSVGMPSFSSLQSNPAEIRRYTLRMLSYLSYGAFPIFFGISAVSIELAALVLGPEWVAVGPVLAILSLIVPLKVINSGLVAAVNGIGRPEITARLMIVAALWISPILFVGTNWGLTGVCFAWIVAYVSWFLYACSKLFVPLSISAKDAMYCIFPPLASGACMWLVVKAIAAVTLGFDLLPVICLGLQVLSGGIVFLGLAYLFDRRTFLGFYGLFANAK